MSEGIPLPRSASSLFGEFDMLVLVKPMVIGGPPTPAEQLEASLQEFFIDDVQVYQDPMKFPLQHQHTHYREGGCQYAFDRDPNAPLRCIDCNLAKCNCSAERTRNRYALQRFTTTRIYILDIDLNGTRPRSYGTFSKYHTLRYEEEIQLRQMEARLMGLKNILLFYRTKCNGFRIGFETETPILNMEDYEGLCMGAEREVERITPDGRLPPADDGKAWFHVDRIWSGGRPFRSHAYWSYPRVQNPIWLNSDRRIP
jgi:hypothetical protein